MQKRFDTELEKLTGKAFGGKSCQFLLAVSGGVDSMCLLELFRCSSLVPHFAVAHCNFGLRGADSDGDESFVRDWAEKYGVPFHSIRFDTEGYAGDRNISIEMAARELRYGWFGRICRDNGYDAVCVAHNLNDNAETLVLNLLRGTGVRGISGMAPVSGIPAAGYDDICLFRPMLGFSRAEIESFMNGRCPHRTDYTNEEIEFKRNRVRNLVFPQFAALNPAFLHTLDADMTHFAQVADVADDYYVSARSGIVISEDASSLMIGIKGLLGLKHWRYVLYRLAEPFGFAQGTLEALSRLLESGSTLSGRVFMSPSSRVMTTSTSLVLRKGHDPVDNHPRSVVVDAPGEWLVCGRVLRVELVDWDASMSPKQPEGIIVMDASKLSFPFIAREWRDGDYLVPLGMTGRKKISDLFVDLHFDIEQKQRSVVICREGEKKSAALAGQRIDSSVKVDASTRKVVKITLI